MRTKIAYLSLFLGLAIFLTTLSFEFVKKNSHHHQKIDLIESALNAEQAKELIPLGTDFVPLFEYRSGQGIRQTTVKKPLFKGDLVHLGNLHEHRTQAMNVPVYLCAYSQTLETNTSLDIHENCSGEGKLVTSKPLGYISNQIQTGFRFMVRCKSPKTGMYLSFHSFCDQTSDQLNGVLGTIQTSEI